MTSGGARDVWPGVRSNIFSVFLSDTVRPAASKTVTMTVINLASPSANLETIPASSANNMPHTALRTQAIGASFPTVTLSSRWTKSLTIYLSSLKRTRTTCITAAKMLTSSGDSTQPCRSPCVTSNHSECSPSGGVIKFYYIFWYALLLLYLVPGCWRMCVVPVVFSSVSQVTVIREPDPHYGTKRSHLISYFAVISK